LGSYRSAWLLWGKLRHSTVAPGRTALAGLVEIAETEIPGRSKNDPVSGGGGRSHQGKMLIVGAVEVQDGGAGPGRIRLNKMSDYSADSLHPFIVGNHGRERTIGRRSLKRLIYALKKEIVSGRRVNPVRAREPMTGKKIGAGGCAHAHRLIFSSSRLRKKSTDPDFAEVCCLP
jgi:hypothetical protein